MSSRGLLVVFEGLDRSGKSTQARKLVDALSSRGQKAKFMRFPERKTVIGELIGEYLTKKKEMDDHAAHLLFSANRWEFINEMKSDLMNGTTLVIDRYAFSGVAYTSAKGYSIDWCKGPDRGLIAPDVVFYLEIPLKEASSRGGYGEERYETQSFQDNVRLRYKQLRDSTWKIVNADRAIDEIHDEIARFTMKLKEENSKAPLNILWDVDEGKPKAIANGRKRKSKDSIQDITKSKNFKENIPDNKL